MPLVGSGQPIKIKRAGKFPTSPWVAWGCGAEKPEGAKLGSAATALQRSVEVRPTEST